MTSNHSRRRFLAVAGMAASAGCVMGSNSNATEGEDGGGGPVPPAGNPAAEANGIPGFARWIPGKRSITPVEYVNHDVDPEIKNAFSPATQAELHYRRRPPKPTATSSATPASPHSPENTYEDASHVFDLRMVVGSTVALPVFSVSEEEFHGYLRSRTRYGDLLVVFADFDVDQFLDPISDDLLTELGSRGEADLYELSGEVLVEKLETTIKARLEYQFAISSSYLALIGKGYGDQIQAEASFDTVDIRSILDARARSDLGLTDTSTSIRNLLKTVGSGDYVIFHWNEQIPKKNDPGAGVFRGETNMGHRVRFGREEFEARTGIGFEDESAAKAALDPINKSVKKHRQDENPEDGSYLLGSVRYASSVSVGRESSVVYLDLTYPVSDADLALDFGPFQP